ncbi:MAG: HD domain-containing phosphohydrolase [Gemmatimonadota bacterium]
MSEAVRFLHALAQALSAASLYSPGHPATRRSLDNVYQALRALLAIDPHPVLLFLGGAPVYAGRALHELTEWPWSRRLSAVGVQRLECDDSVTPEAIPLFIEQLMVRLSTGATTTEEELPIPGLRFGNVAVLEEVALEPSEQAFMVAGSSHELLLDLSDELEAMAWVRSEAARGVVARGEAEAVVRILGALFEHHQLPQVAHGDDSEQYPLVHAINTALLTMAAAAPWVDRPGRHRLGVAALLHDIGMAQIPTELGKKEMLTIADRVLVESHTGLGARLLLESGGRGLELAAAVAYEHHLRPDQSGYPARRFRPVPHWASRLVTAASTYAALRSPRVFRPRWAADRALAYLVEGAGTVFDAEAANMVAALVRSA